MISFLKSLFTAPVFSGDAEKTRRASLLNAILLAGFIMTAAILAGNLLAGDTPARSYLIDLLLLACIALLRWLLHRGHIRALSLGIMLTGFGFMSIVIMNEGSILVPATSGLMVFVVISGILFDAPGIILSTLVSAVITGLIAYAQLSGLLPHIPDHVTLMHWFVYTLLYASTGGLSYFVYRSQQKALEQARLEISQRERVQLELRKLTRAVEQSPASIVITDTSGAIEYVNSRFTQVTGYTAAEALGQNPRILKSNLTPAETHRQLWDALSAGREWQGEFTNHKKDGAEYVELAHISPITNQNGEITHYLAVKEDITARKQVEIALRESEQLYHAMFDRSQAIQLLLDPADGSIVGANQAAANFYGYPITQLTSLPVSAINPMPAADYRAALGQAVHATRNYFIVQHRLSSGAVRDVEVYTGPIRLKGKTLLHSIIHDITARLQAESQLQEAHARLEQRVHERTAELQKTNLLLERASRAKDEFLAMISHELRTPLTGILGLSQVLQLESFGALNEKQMGAVRNIEKSGQRLHKLVAAILKYSSLQSGQTDLDRQDYSLVSACKTLFEQFSEQAAQKGHQLSFTAPAELVIHADEQFMSQAVSLLLDNAIKSTPPGGSLRLALSADPQNHQALISVSDNGVGIQPDDLPRIFQPFTQVDSRLAREFEGAGMSLALVKLLAELHGGSVEVSSTPGSGSCFSLILPWEDEQPS